MEPGLLVEMEGYASENNIPVIRCETADILKILTTVKRPLRVLELGTAIGYSALLIRMHAPDGCRIDTIDNDYDMVLAARKYIERAGYGDQINIIYGDALDVITSLSCRYDMVFFDSAKSDYIRFFENSIRILNEGAVLIADNVLYKGMVNDESHDKRKHRTIVRSLRRFIDTVSDDKRFITAVLDIGDGLSVSCYVPGPKE